MHFDKTEVVFRFAPERGYAVHRQPGVFQGLAHRDAVGVLLLQPLRVEVAHQRARAQKGSLVTLAFFFGEAHHFEVERQAFAGSFEFPHAGHGHKDAKPAIVFARVANRVVMAAGKQGARAGFFSVLGVVTANHIADRVYRNLVEATLQHTRLDLRRAGAVRVGQVGDGELAFFGVTGVGVDAQLLMPVPHLVAQFRRYAELVVQANFDDAVDVAQALLQLETGVVEQPAFERGQDFLLGQAQPARTAHGQDKREAELGRVGRIQARNVFKLLLCALGQPGFALFGAGLRGQRVAHHGFAGQLRVRADQGQLRVVSGCLQHLRHGVFEMRQRAKRPLAECLPGDPGRMLVQAGQHATGLRQCGVIELLQRNGHGCESPV